VRRSNRSRTERAALVQFLHDGGTLLGDACCGRPEFASSFHAEIKKIVAKINELRVLSGNKSKRTVATEEIAPDLASQVKALVAQGIRDAIMIPNKTARQERLDLILKGAIEKLKQPDDPNRERHIKIVFHGLEYTEVRNMILEKGSRADGRGPLRPLPRAGMIVARPCGMMTAICCGWRRRNSGPTTWPCVTCNCRALTASRRSSEFEA